MQRESQYMGMEKIEIGSCKRQLQMHYKLIEKSDYDQII